MCILCGTGRSCPSVRYPEDGKDEKEEVKGGYYEEAMYRGPAGGREREQDEK